MRRTKLLVVPIVPTAGFSRKRKKSEVFVVDVLGKCLLSLLSFPFLQSTNDESIVFLGNFKEGAHAILFLSRSMCGLMPRRGRER